MFNSEVTYQVGLAHLDGLRREADDRRLANIGRSARYGLRSIGQSGRLRQPRPGVTTLS